MSRPRRGRAATAPVTAILVTGPCCHFAVTVRGVTVRAELVKRAQDRV